MIIELAAALSVLLLGFLALVRLMKASGEDATQAARDTVAAQFADAVMNGLRAEAVDAATAGRWTEFWSGMQSGSNSLSVAAQTAWSEPFSSLVVFADSRPTNIRFRIHHYHATDEDTPLVDHGVWYRLQSQADDRIAKVTLRVWPVDAPTSAVTRMTPNRMYTEIWKPEGL